MLGFDDSLGACLLESLLFAAITCKTSLGSIYCCYWIGTMGEILSNPFLPLVGVRVVR